MHLHRSNRVERLLGALFEVIERPLSDPFAPEVIVVQSRGMERWLAMQLAERFSVFANGEFPFPRHLLDRVFDAALDDPKERLAVFQPEALAFAIATLLREKLDEPAFAQAKQYLQGDDDGALRLGLAQKLARLLDDYAVYRPELILGWERGEEPNELQAELLRALVARYGRGHYAARAERFFEALGHGELDRTCLPERICWFGVASLPPLYVQLLAALSAHVETHLFVLAPTNEYFGDLPAGRERRRAQAASDSDAAGQGHPLIASFGRLGRDFQVLLLEHAGEVTEHDVYEDPGKGTLLHTLQSDMLELYERPLTERLSLAPADSSISIHSCHGPMREVEVLHDQLARLLEDESLEPHEIVVMTPDIESYAPMIDAVFGSAAQGARPRIPYAIAHRAARPESPIVDALQAAIDVLCSRVTAREVLDLLAREPVRARAGLEPEDLERLRSLIRDSGIRSGLDAEHKKELGLPPNPEGTLRFGLERMLLGYALEGSGQHTFGGRLPLDLEGTEQADLAGTLSAFCERVLRHRRAVNALLPLERWAAWIEELLDDLVGATPAVAAQRSAIRMSVVELCEQAKAGGLEEAIGLFALRPKLAAALDARAPARGFLSRGVTFCQLEPMRGIPFEVVCLLGMNDETFPSRAPVLALDRMQRQPKRGDRAPREDDRHVFLEALLCARRELIITYIGRDAHDDRVLPPAVVVSDLVDAVARGFVVAGANDSGDSLPDIEARLVVAHRLHPFSPRYFDGGSLFSYSQHDCVAARASRDATRAPGFFDQPLSAPPLEELSLERLCDYLTRPTRTLIQRQLGVSLGADAKPLVEREPIEPDALERWWLGRRALELLLDGAPEESLHALLHATGAMPPGAAGFLTFEATLGPARAIAAAKQERFPGAPVRPFLLELEANGVRLHATVRNAYPTALLEVSYSKLGRRDETRAFLQHVFACALRQTGGASLPERSVVIAAGGDHGGADIASFRPVPSALSLLEHYVTIAREAQSHPLPLDHDAARAYAEVIHAGKSASAARKAARAKWRGDPYTALATRDSDVIADPRFGKLACEVFLPLLTHRDPVESVP